MCARERGFVMLRLAELALVLSFSLSCHAVQYAGNVVATTVGVNTIDFTLSQGAIARVEMLNEGLVRVRVNPQGSFTTHLTGALAPSGMVAPKAAIYDLPTAAFLVSANMIVTVLKAPFQIVIMRADGTLVNADKPNGVYWDQTGLIVDQKFALPGDHYFGMGDRGGPLDRRGRSFYMRNVDWAAYGEYTDPLYISIPFFYGLNNGLVYGLYLDNAAYPVFSFDADNSGTLLFGAQAGELDYYVMTGPDPGTVANLYGKLTGFSAFPPLWTLGFHQSRYSYTESQALNVANTLRSLGIPCDSIYFDIGYMNRLQQFTWDPVNFPTPQAMNATLDSLGFQRVNIFEPLVRTDDALWPYLAGSRYLLEDANGAPVVSSIWYGDVGFIDFTKDSARTWYSQVLQQFFSQGVTAAWNDLNEPAAVYMPTALFNYNGENRSETEARNIYALAENALSYQSQLDLRPNQRPWALSRSGFAGIQRYAANWSGDENSTWDSLRVSVQITNHMGLSGQNQFGHDVGGFLGSPSAELFLRWLEFGSYIPLFRNHATNTSAPREPYAFGEPYTTMARNIINQRYQLLPYLYSLQRMASTNGSPVVAPLLFYYPQDSNTYSQDQEFLLGPYLLIAPMTVEGATSRDVYLPAGANWTDVQTGVSYPGAQQITVAAPLDRIPVFAREGAIIPQGPIKQFVEQAVTPGLSIDIYPGPDSQFTMYEDDGTSFDYQNGSYLNTLVKRSNNSQGSSISIQRIAGTWSPAPRSITLLLHGTTQASGVSLNGTALPQTVNLQALVSASSGWIFDPAAQLVAVKIQDSTQAATVFVQP
jgi:alpha-glucosidase